jgi:hypothetical protein
MPYCWKCGAKLEEDTKFCVVCGTRVGPAPTELRARRKVQPLRPLVIILIAIIAVAAILIGLTFIPIYEVGPVNSQISIARKTGVNTLNLNLDVDVGHVNIHFENLTSEPESPSIIINTTAVGRVSVFGSNTALDRYMPVSQNETAGNVLTVTVEQKADGVSWLWRSSLNVTFDVIIDWSMDTSLNVTTSTGGILLDTQAGIKLSSTSLRATTGGAEANLAQDVIVTGDFSIETTTGGVKLSWNNPTVTNSVRVDAITTTGGVDVNFTQYDKLAGNITLRAEAVTGGINFTLDIKNNIGAKIESTVTTGGINVARQDGFSGTKTPLQSNNYPSAQKIDAILKTTTGGIRIDAKYTP